MNEKGVMTLQEASEYCGYADKNQFMDAWVLPHQVPFEIRGKRKFFLKRILDDKLLEVALNTAKSIYRK